MQIEKIYVKTFGKLKDFEMTFNSGLNTIVQNNSFGKSTLATFIKAMFYGFEYKKKNGVDFDVRMVAPWDVKGTFGGYLDFSHNGKNYRVERYFGSAGRYEKGQLIDRNTGEVYAVTNLGKHLFGVEAQAFEQSLFIPQDTVQITANADFVSKLTNMVDGNQQQNNFDKAEKALTEFSKEFKHLKGNGGQIFHTEMEIARLKVELKQVQDDNYRLETNKNRLKIVESNLVDITNKIDASEQQIQSLKQSIALKECSVDTNQKQAFDQASNYLKTHSASVVADYDKAVQLYQQRQAVVTPKISPFIWLMLLVATAGIVLAVALPNLWFVGVGICMLGALGTTLIGANFVKKKSQVQQSIGQAESNLHTLFLAHGVEGTTDQKLVELHTLKEKWLEQQTIYNTLKQSVGSTLDTINETKQLAQLVDTHKQLVETSNNLIRERGSLEAQIDALSKGKKEFEVKEALQNTTQKLAELQQKHQTIQLTLQLLRQAKTNVSSNYLPPLTGKVATLLKNVVDIQDVVIDKDFGISLQENAITRKVQYFSRGIQELTAFCFRVALSQSVYGELPLLVVDDAFVNLDETNFAKAMQILKDLSTTTQVIYFSCHERSKTN